MVSAHAARAQPIRPGRDVRAEHKFELPKLRATGSGPVGGLTLRVRLLSADCHTAQVWARTYYFFILQDHN